MSATKEAFKAFVQGLDTANRDRLKAVATTAFNQYVDDAPGPDKISRPLIEKAIRKAIDDLCGQE